jgi:hypothetical protein
LAAVARLTPQQQATRSRVEGLIAIAEPLLNALLAVGERVSRVAEPTDHEYYPIRPGGQRVLDGEAAELVERDTAQAP